MKIKITVAILVFLSGCYIGEQPKISIKLDRVIEDYENVRIVRNLDGSTQFYSKEVKIVELNPQQKIEKVSLPTKQPLDSRSDWEIYPKPD